MIDCAIYLEAPLMEMIQDSEFEELRKYNLTDRDWETLSICHEILLVSIQVHTKIVIKWLIILQRFPMLSSSFSLQKKLQLLDLLFWLLRAS